MFKNPEGAGAKTVSNRVGFAMFFLVFGFFILALDSIVDIYWFYRHCYQTDLDVVAKQKQEARGYGIVNSINRRTFKKMLHYFEL